MDVVKFTAALRYRLCWICGEALGRFKAFVVGPMCAVNRTSAEPPSHFDCAEFSVKACPFLSNPDKRRRDSNLPEHNTPAGIALERNPGVSLIWVTTEYRFYHVKQDEKVGGGILFDIGNPDQTYWYARVA